MAKVCIPRPRWFVYLPLIGHIIPTIIIGYGTYMKGAAGGN